MRVLFRSGAADSAWAKLGPDPRPVVVAVIDSGLDWNHADLDWANIWKNPGETAGNGIDDDGNGYVDDIIGWDFLGNNNKPWDHDGHGTIRSEEHTSELQSLMRISYGVFCLEKKK